MNSVGDGSLQRVRWVSVDRATVSPAREKCRPHPPHGQAPRSRASNAFLKSHAFTLARLKVVLPISIRRKILHEELMSVQ
jgi:hypothetical protein